MTLCGGFRGGGALWISESVTTLVSRRRPPHLRPLCPPPAGCAKCQDFKGCTACSFNYTLTALPWDDPSVPCEDCTSFSCKPCGEVAAAACNECPTSMVSELMAAGRNHVVV